MRKKIAVVFLWAALVYFSAPADDGDGFWERAKEGTKRAVKGVKKGGKELGRGVQEIFDPEDEDLQAEKKGSKKKKKKKSDEDSKDE